MQQKTQSSLKCKQFQNQICTFLCAFVPLCLPSFPSFLFLSLASSRLSGNRLKLLHSLKHPQYPQRILIVDFFERIIGKINAVYHPAPLEVMAP